MILPFLALLALGIGCLGVIVLSVGRKQSLETSNIDNKTSGVNVDGGQMCCASCGIVATDNVKLKKCAACESVRYCSVECQRKHRPDHKEGCKKRAAELRDEILFKQPESSYLGDCPICCLPLSIDPRNSPIQTCCSTVVCDGCEYANRLRQEKECLELTCPFCRHPVPTFNEEAESNKMKRVKVNDPVALRQMGCIHSVAGDSNKALEYLSKAAGLGDADGHHCLSTMYLNGEGVKKDKKKGAYHAEEAAIKGHPTARFNLGCIEWNNGTIERNIGMLERAAKHFIISANLGHGEAMKMVKTCYSKGLVSKEDFAKTLRAHQAVLDAARSSQREAAAEAKRLGLSFSHMHSMPS